jgi:DNA replication protein DnaC
MTADELTLTSNAAGAIAAVQAVQHGGPHGRLAKDLEDFQFNGTPIDRTLVNDLAGGFIAQLRHVVLVGRTGTVKTHLAIAVARSCIRSGACGRFFNVVDLVNRLDIETRSGR